jgi:hexosaminidase
MKFKEINKAILLLVLMITTGFVGFTQNETFNVIPYPFKVIQNEGVFRVNSEFSIALQSTQDDKILEDAANRFAFRLRCKTLAYLKQERVSLNQTFNNARMSVQVKSKAVPSIGVDESYVLSVTPESIILKSNTTIGALRGFETLLQMVSADKDGYFIPATEIVDEPRFKWRGMMVDVARHFLPIEILKKNIDAMAVVKLNVLHIHLTDDEGFRVESKLYPKLHQLGSNGRYYSQSELVDLVKYASDRGIIIVPEFDLPGHSRSWFAGYPELASAPGPYKPGPRFTFDPSAPREQLAEAVKSAPTPTLDPTREEVYDFLYNFFGEMANIFPAPYFHIGADENNGAAWQKNPKIVQFMNDRKMKDTHELHSYFVNRVYGILQKHNRTMIGWQEAYSNGLQKDVIIQAWVAQDDPTMKAVPPLEIAQKGNPVLISTGFYLDLFMPSSVHYLNPEYSANMDKNVLGGEAALWSELVDENSFEGRAWPRTASVAERLWSKANITDVDDMYRRLYILSDELEASGLNHRLNTRRWLSVLANGTSTDAASLVCGILAPFKGYMRLAISMMQPSNLKYETVPLVNLPDFVEVDSEVEWKFRKLVGLYLKDRNLNAEKEIENQLKKWAEASLQVEQQVWKAPNLKILESYSDRIIKATEIGLKALKGTLNETQKADAMKQLKAMKLRTDMVEIRILDEIQALVSGKLED